MKYEDASISFTPRESYLLWRSSNPYDKESPEKILGGLLMDQLTEWTEVIDHHLVIPNLTASEQNKFDIFISSNNRKLSRQAGEIIKIAANEDNLNTVRKLSSLAIDSVYSLLTKEIIDSSSHSNNILTEKEQENLNSELFKENIEEYFTALNIREKINEIQALPTSRSYQETQSIFRKFLE